MPELRRHLESFTPSGPDALVFVHAKGGQLRRSNFSKPWARALGQAGLPSGVHVHDLRHTGNTLTAEAGASLAELMTPDGSFFDPGGGGVPARPGKSGTASSRMCSTGWRGVS